MDKKLPERDALVNDYVRTFWITRCRIHAPIPDYVIENYSLRDLFEFAPVSANRSFSRAIREKPGGTTPTDHRERAPEGDPAG